MEWGQRKIWTSRLGGRFFLVLVPGVMALICAGGASGSPLEPVESIMAKVAQNQDRAQELRSHFIYQQNLLVRFKRGDGKVCREELHEFAVTPSGKGTLKTLTRFQGKYLKEGVLIEYAKPHYNYKDLDLDGELISDFADDFTDEKNSRDGINTNFFPFASSEQYKYAFTLKGKETFRGREVYQVTFKPSKKAVVKRSHAGEDSQGMWAGEILVDVQEYQPVFVSTRLATGIPFWVKTLLGTNIKQLGFKLEYDRFDDGLWFPVNYGGEFKLKAVFFYKRTMAIALQNSGFQRAKVTTTLSFGDSPGADRASTDSRQGSPPETARP